MLISACFKLRGAEVGKENRGRSSGVRAGADVVVGMRLWYCLRGQRGKREGLEGEEEEDRRSGERKRVSTGLPE